MRLVLVPVVLALAAGSACGSGSKAGTETLTPLDQVRAAAKTVSEGSSKLALTSDTKVGAQDVKIDGLGAFETVGGVTNGSFTLTLLGKKVEEKIVDGVLYLKIPGQESYYKLKVSDLVGTQLADSSSPTSSAKLLAAIDGVTKVGTATVRGTKTTQYSGTIDVKKAVARFKGGALQGAIDKFSSSGVSSIPVQVFLDDKGRLRRLTEHVVLMIQGQTADSTTQLDLFDFGTKVDVTAPPAEQVKDGAPLLAQLKAATG